MTTRRAFTLLELVMTLALLSGVTIIVASLIELSARVTPQEVTALEWQNAAQRLVHLIAEDLHVGDFGDKYGRPDQAFGRARVVLDETETALAIVTRARRFEGQPDAQEGAILQEYMFDADHQAIFRHARRLGPQSPIRDQRVLLKHVKRWHCSVLHRTDPDEDVVGAPALLVITIVGENTAFVGRVILREEVEIK